MVGRVPSVIVGAGFTKIVAVIGVPLHVVPKLVKLGVMVNVTVTGAFVVLVKAPLILPLPVAAMPVTSLVLSCVQL